MEASSVDCDAEFDPAPLKALSRAFMLYREHVPSGSLLQLDTFLVLALQGDPIALTELARAVGTVKPVVTAAIGNLGPHGRGPAGNRSTPPNLVYCTDHPTDGRSKLAGLTPKGAELAAKMRDLLSGGLVEAPSCSRAPS
jgi:DNA-binding MarR family transcriptional regulator